MKNLRRYERIEYPLKVACLTNFQIFETKTRNFSLQGACLFSPVEFEPGEDLSLIFKLPVKKMFAVPAQVVWSKRIKSSEPYGYQIGVEYICLPSPYRRELETLIKKLGS